MALYNSELIEKLYIKHIYRDTQSIKSDRKKIVEDYLTITGVKLNAQTLKNYIRDIDKEKAYSQRSLNTQHVDEAAHVSERYIEIPTSESLSDEDIIQMHGLDIDKWDIDRLGSTRSKIGTNGNDDGYLINTYQKVQFKPKQFRLTLDKIEKLVASMFSPKDKIIIEPKLNNPNGLLLIPLKDMHIGLNTYEDYKPHQAQLYRYIQSQEYEEIIFIIGSDLFHTNDSNGRTANDTQVDFNVEIEERMEWAKQFYQPLLEAAQEKALKVKVIFEPGNHDRDTSLMFAVAMKWLYPNIEFEIEEKKIYKGITFHDVFIGTHHGDMKKKPESVAEVFNNYFKLEIAQAKYREVLIGHLHHTWSKEHLDIHVQGLATASKSNDYEYRLGFEGGNRSFQVRLYSHKALRAMLIIDGQ